VQLRPSARRYGDAEHGVCSMPMPDCRCALQIHKYNSTVDDYRTLLEVRAHSPKIA
jgi:hypothetical protein